MCAASPVLGPQKKIIPHLACLLARHLRSIRLNGEPTVGAIKVELFISVTLKRQTTMNRSLVKAGCRQSHLLTQCGCLYSLRPHPKSKKAHVDSTAAPQDKTLPATLDAIVCRQCLHVITSAAEHQVINGAHTHTFANPEGIVFEIACYRNAWGCGYVGSTSTEFTWFTGYAWRIALCLNCLVHLGWRFSAPDGDFFHGLITSRLIANG